MRIVMLSTESRVFEQGRTRERLSSYGVVADEVTYVVFASGKRTETILRENVRAIRVGGSVRIVVLLRGLELLLRMATARKIDVVSSQDPFFLGLVGVIAKMIKRVPLQIQIHTDCFSPQYRSESLRRRFESALARYVVKRASCVRVVSERVRASVARLTRAPVSVLPIAHKESVTGKTKHESIEPFTFLILTRLSKEKRIGVIIDALQHVEGARLLIVGDGPLRESLMNHAKKLALHERVIFAGWQTDPEQSFANSHAFIQVSRYEGYGLSLYEAALHGLPLISTDVGIVGETFAKDTEVLIVDAEPESVARAMHTLMQNPDMCRELGERARQKAENVAMRFDDYLKKYAEAIRTCVS